MAQWSHERPWASVAGECGQHLLVVAMGHRPCGEDHLERGAPRLAVRDEVADCLEFECGLELRQCEGSVRIKVKEPEAGAVAE
jgi:hypothetical protein